MAATVGLVTVGAGHTSAFSASTIAVPGSYPTIQAALDAAAPGDTVSVAPGQYPENVDFHGKAVNLISSGGATITAIAGVGGTTVSAGPGGSVVGFTISGGTASFGAGMAVNGPGTLVRKNIFQSNTESSGGFGAAIGGNSSSPTIEQNIFTGNSCDNQFLSGVVAFINGSSPMIRNNVFRDNPCRAVNLSVPAGSLPRVINNTIVRNTVGVRVDGRIPSLDYVVSNNILAGNGTGLEVDFGNTPTWDHNLVSGNGIDYSGVTDPTGTSGNLRGDPLFMDGVANDFHLQLGSPAFGAGGNANAPDTDFDGRDRGARIDLGAFQTDSDLRIGVHAPVAADATMPAGALVGYTPPVASDEDVSSVGVACSPVPGAIFAIGTTTVTCTATDPDDTNSPQSSEFVVTVRGAAEQLHALEGGVRAFGHGDNPTIYVVRAEFEFALGLLDDACLDLHHVVRRLRRFEYRGVSTVNARKLRRDALRIEHLLLCH